MLKGMCVCMVLVYDNLVGNFDNLSLLLCDVIFGECSIDEMVECILYYIYVDEEIGVLISEFECIDEYFEILM